MTICDANFFFLLRDAPNFLSEGKSIIVKLLLSVNRRESLLEAEENIREAIAAHIAHPGIVVGVDLSGNPSCGNVIDDLIPMFSKARDCGLKVALHCGEVNHINSFICNSIV